MRDRRPAPFVTMHATGARVSHAARTDERGEFTLTGLPPGLYRLRHARQTEGSADANRSLRLLDGFETKAVVELLPGE